MTFENTVTLGDLLAGLVGLAAFAVSIVALRIAGSLARKGATQPFVLENLYDLYSYGLSRAGQQSPPDVIVESFYEDIRRYRKAKLILEVVGFKDHVQRIDPLISQFLNTRDSIKTTSTQLTAEQGQQLLDAALEVNRLLDDVITALEPRIRQAIRDPFQAFDRSSN